MAWGGYSNGRIPKNQLKAVPGNGTVGNSTVQYLQKDAADAFLRMKADYDKVKGSGILTITEGYRDYDKQVALRNKYLNGTGNLAAVAGKSIHGWALAADFGYPVTAFGSIGHNWLIKNARNYGWAFQGTEGKEPWHFEYIGLVSGSGATGGYSAEVEWRQRNLFYLGYNVKIDGFDGSNTDEGTKAFQGDEDLAKDGYGPITKARIALRVKERQEKLAAKGFYKGPIDSDAGAGTLAATKAYQKSVGLPDDGRAGKVTWASMQKSDGKILQLQINLNLLGESLLEDDREGESTDAAVRRFQAKEGLAQDGYGPITEARIQLRIKELQEKLLKKGFNPGLIDGIGGDNTKNAVIAYQKSVGLTPDGKAGPNTIKALDTNVVPPVVIPVPTPSPIKKVTPPTGYILGVDVAYPQTQAFDADKIKESLSFIAIKRSGAEDPAPNQIYGPALMSDKHLAFARSISKPVVFYHFNNAGVSVKAQADKMIEVVKDVIKPGDMIALDIEPNGSVVQFSPAQALEFANYIEKAFGVKTLMYMNRSEEAKDWSAVVKAGHPLWLAAWVGITEGIKLTPKNWKQWTILQYNVDKGIYGYPGDIDVDIALADTFDKYGFKKFPESPVSPVEPSEPPVDPETPGSPESPSEGDTAALSALIQQLIDLLKKIFKIK